MTTSSGMTRAATAAEPVTPLVHRPGADDVGPVPVDVPRGAPVMAGGAPVPAGADIPAGHKVAVRAVAAGRPVRQYGEAIGQALADIRPGEHVHLHNLGPGDPPGGRLPGWSGRPVWTAPAAAGRDHFLGYRRPDGRAATRNYIAVVPTVNCSATVARMVAQAAQRVHAGIPGLDGVIALTHDLGCGMAQGTAGDDLLRRTLRGHTTHPNVAGAVVISLGCEINQPADALGGLAVPTVTIQDVGGTPAAVTAALAAVAELAQDVRALRREPLPLSALTLGLHGGDTWAGPVANPVLGVAADLLVAAGGRVVLGETPLLHAAAHVLGRRAASARVAGRVDELAGWWEEYAARNGAELPAVPSGGNRHGGVTTVREQALGALLKAGTSPLNDVVGYAEPVTAAGLTLMDTPGRTAVAATGMVAGGATLLASTAAAGPAPGSRPSPCVRVGATTGLAGQPPGDLDADTGAGLTTAERTAAGRWLFETLIDIASGRPSISEQLAFGAEEIVPWRMGAVL
jgi:altronate hydrolase